jgi:hypothetical protein
MRMPPVEFRNESRADCWSAGIHILQQQWYVDRREDAVKVAQQILFPDREQTRHGDRHNRGSGALREPSQLGGLHR